MDPQANQPPLQAESPLETDLMHRLLLEHMDLGYALHEAQFDALGRLVDYRFLEVNPAYERLTGLAASLLVGRHVLQVLPGIERRWFEVFGAALRDGTPHQHEDFTAPLGRWYQTTCYPVGATRFVVLIQDVTDRRAKEERLRRGEEGFRLLAENSLDIVLRLDLDGRYLWASPSVGPTLGLDPAKLVGRSSLEFVHPEDLPLVRRVLGQAIATGSPGQATFRHVTETGKVIWLESLGRTVLDPATGSPQEFLVSSRDVTERMAAQARVAEMAHFNRTLLDTCDCLIIVLDSAGRIQMFNRTAEDLLGWKEQELLGTPFYEVLVPPGRREIVREVFRNPESFTLRRFENDWLCRDGSLRRILWSNSDLRDPEHGLQWIVCTGLDRTEARRAEEEIRELNESLERKVAERTRELRRANEDLESFSYAVSHDLRAPLRAIDGFSLALLEDAGSSLDAACRDHLDRIRSATENMARLIDDLLEHSRTGRFPLDCQDLDLSSMAGQIAATLARSDQDRNLLVRIEPGLRMRADPTLLRAILENLLGNAWKYTRPREYPRIELRREWIDGRPWIAVSDNGVGFSMEHARNLFGAFQRLHPRDQFEGSGIGLANVRKMVERHGGQVHGEGIPDQGALFRFTLEAPSDRMAPGDSS